MGSGFCMELVEKRSFRESVRVVFEVRARAV